MLPPKYATLTVPPFSHLEKKLGNPLREEHSTAISFTEMVEVSKVFPPSNRHAGMNRDNEMIEEISLECIKNGIK